MNNVKIVCRALILDDSQRLLLVKKTGSDFWSLPGGKLDVEDVSVHACLIREVKEELGVVATLGDIRFVQELHKKETRYIELIWQATTDRDPLESGNTISGISGGELEDIRWFGKEERAEANIKPEFLCTV